MAKREKRTVGIACENCPSKGTVELSENENLVYSQAVFDTRVEDISEDFESQNGPLPIYCKSCGSIVYH